MKTFSEMVGKEQHVFIIAMNHRYATDWAKENGITNYTSIYDKHQLMGLKDPDIVALNGFAQDGRRADLFSWLEGDGRAYGFNVTKEAEWLEQRRRKQMQGGWDATRRKWLTDNGEEYQVMVWYTGKDAKAWPLGSQVLRRRSAGKHYHYEACNYHRPELVNLIETTCSNWEWEWMLLEGPKETT